MDQANIQVRNRTGDWTTVMVVENRSPNIANALKSMEASHPGCRVRAVDAAGRVVDML